MCIRDRFQGNAVICKDVLFGQACGAPCLIGLAIGCVDVLRPSVNPHHHADIELLKDCRADTPGQLFHLAVRTFLHQDDLPAAASEHKAAPARKGGGLTLHLLQQLLP